MRTPPSIRVQYEASRTGGWGSEQHRRHGPAGANPVSRLPRRCLSCGALTRTAGRCGRCEPSHAQKYGGKHRKQRRALIEALLLSGGRALCAYCTRPLGTDPSVLELDHAVPIVDGGLHGPKRLVHAKCNSRAGGVRGTSCR